MAKPITDINNPDFLSDANIELLATDAKPSDWALGPNEGKNAPDLFNTSTPTPGAEQGGAAAVDDEETYDDPEADNGEADPAEESADAEGDGDGDADDDTSAESEAADEKTSRFPDQETLERSYDEVRAYANQQKERNDALEARLAAIETKSTVPPPPLAAAQEPTVVDQFNWALEHAPDRVSEVVASVEADADVAQQQAADALAAGDTETASYWSNVAHNAGKTARQMDRIAAAKRTEAAVAPLHQRTFEQDMLAAATRVWNANDDADQYAPQIQQYVAAQIRQGVDPNKPLDELFTEGLLAARGSNIDSIVDQRVAAALAAKEADGRSRVAAARSAATGETGSQGMRDPGTTSEEDDARAQVGMGPNAGRSGGMNALFDLGLKG